VPYEAMPCGHSEENFRFVKIASVHTPIAYEWRILHNRFGLVKLNFSLAAQRVAGCSPGLSALSSRDPRAIESRRIVAAPAFGDADRQAS
jgi:hypothetical protein